MHFLASWKRALGVDLISYRSQYHIVCIFLPWIRLSNEGCMLSIHCKIALFFYFPLWPVRHFENSSRRACALRGVSGCVHLESRKTNVRRTGERVWYDAWVCVRNCVKRFSFSLFLRLKAGVADTAGTWDTIYIYIYIYIYVLKEVLPLCEFVPACWFGWFAILHTFFYMKLPSIPQSTQQQSLNPERNLIGRHILATLIHKSFPCKCDIFTPFFTSITLHLRFRRTLISARLISRNIYFLSRNES